MEAVITAKRDGIIKPTLIGHEGEIKSILADFGEPEADYAIVQADSLEDAVDKAIEMVHTGRADLIVKGIIETGQLMKKLVNKETGICESGLVSAVGLFELPKYHKLIAISDMGINTYPDVNKKQSIIENAVGLLHSLGLEEPKVAALAAVERFNPKMPETVDAAELKRRNEAGELTGCIVEGPISLDLAVLRESAKTKGYESPVAGEADMLLVPDIVSGNLLVKALGIFGGAKSADVVLGCKVPIVFGSRGGPIAAKYNSIALAARNSVKG